MVTCSGSLFIVALLYSGAKQPLGRMPSNVSELSETSDLKSSTAYKFNYRAYRKKISTKHDTVTDLFVYNPVS